MTNGSEPAYPLKVPVMTKNNPLEKIGDHYFYGLTKREYFAGLAMQGLCANGHYGNLQNELLAEEALSISDALIAEMNK